MDQERGGDNVMSGGSVGGPFIQARSIGKVVVQQGVPAPGRGGRADDDAWVRQARGSSVWDHVPANRNVDEYRESTAAVTARLAALRDETQDRLSEDPWQEPAFALRFAERVEWLLGEPSERVRLDLYPAEAALLVLAPFLYRVHALRAAVRRLDVEPWKLEPSYATHGSDRAAFEAFADSHGLLVQRALLRRESEASIGWWLFHRWLVQFDAYEGSTGVDPVVGLLEELGEPATTLGEALAPRRVSRLLHGLRRGPDVCNPEYLDTLPADDGLRGPGHQRVRDQRLVLLAALAYAASVEMTALPDIVVEHLGIPHPVDLDELRAALQESGWGGSAELPVLRAECAHEAVIEGLRAYVVRADELLHTVSRTVRERVNQPVPTLPSRLSADGVCPSDSAFMGWTSFRLDERRIRDLLMGVQLYKDRDLAVRELYQNALDACRYRRARTEYLDRTHPAASYTYEGLISFEQGVDDDGREYVECRDNGIGMGEAELRGVFSNAGARFAEQPDFKEERAAWGRLDPPVTLYPNSRFGIGVLSYFMLADEIRVTTCRMGPTGRPGPVLRVSIFGPGHLFRIVRVAEEGTEPGTVVRLYLQTEGEGDARWSCPEVLRRFLGIAEFRTTARHDKETAEWPPGVLAGREASRYEYHGLRVHGMRLPWQGAPDGTQVIWCERGGGLLVDGLLVQPTQHGGGVSPKMTGVVVNLAGPYAPGRLSVDRAQVLDDVRDGVQELLKGALEALCAGDAFPDYRWLAEVADDNMLLADLITAECVEKRHWFRMAEAHEYEAARAGFLLSDLQLVFPDMRRRLAIDRTTILPTPDTDEARVPDHILLWRLLAHRPHPLLTELAQLCPELETVDHVLPALPSDDKLLTAWRRSRRGNPFVHKNFERRLSDYAHSSGRSFRETVLRSARLNLLASASKTLMAAPPGAGQEETQVSATPLTLPRSEIATGVPDPTRDDLSPYLMYVNDAIPPRPPLADGALPYTRLLAEVDDLGEPLDQVIARAEALGFRIPLRVPQEMTPFDQELLTRRGALSWRGVNTTDAMPFAHVIAAARTLLRQPKEISARLNELGVRTSCADLPAGLSLRTAEQLLRDTQGERLQADGHVGLASLVLSARDLEIPVRQAHEWLVQLGIKVADPAAAIRAALPLVPRPDTRPTPPPPPQTPSTPPT